MSLSGLLARVRPLMEARCSVAGPVPCTLFFSMTDGDARARVVRGVGDSFEQAWQAGATCCQREASKHSLRVSWLRVDRVLEVQATTWGELSSRLALTKRNYFRLGLALDAELTHAFLEQQLNANAMLYLGSGTAAAGINKKNFTVYAQQCFGKDVPLDFAADRPVYIFSHEGVFLADDKALTSLPLAKEPVLLPAPSKTVLRWRDASSLNAGRRQIERLDQNQVYALIESSANYLSRQVKKSGQFIYGHFPCFGRHISAYNTLRHASSLYSMLEAWELTRSEALMEAIRKALAYLTDTIVRHYPQEDGSTLAYNVDVNGEIKLGANAVSLLALVKYDELTGDTRHRKLMEALALGIARMQSAETGSFVHVLNAEDLSLKNAFRIVYYDGEAAFGLMRLYGLTKDPRWLEIVERAFDYFIAAEHWKHHDHWLSYCANELTLHKPDEKYFRFGVQNVAGYLDFILTRETTYPTLLELSMAFEAMLRRIETRHPEMRHVLEGLDTGKFHRALHYRAHYLLNGFFWPEMAMYFAKPSSIVGSFFIRHHTFRVRIDDVEHYLSGYVAYWKLLQREHNQGSHPASDVGSSVAFPLPASGGSMPVDTQRASVGLLMYPVSPKGFREVEAYAAKGESKGLSVIYLSYRNQHVEPDGLAGYRYERGTWVQGIYPLPSVIDNAPPRNAKERAWFERLSGFAYLTCHKLGGKNVTLPILANDKRSAPFVIESAELGPASVRRFLDEYGVAVIKPVRSNRGRNVFLLRGTKEGNVEVVGGETREVLRAPEFDEFLGARKASLWLVQRYVPSVDSSGNAFDIRVALFRSDQGRWRVARAYARQGANGVTSNLATGGVALDAASFLDTLYPSQQAREISAQLEDAALAIAEVLQEQYPFLIDALGCDFGVAKGEIYLFEVNSYPGMKGCLDAATDAKVEFHQTLLLKSRSFPAGSFLNSKSLLGPDGDSQKTHTSNETCVRLTAGKAATGLVFREIRLPKRLKSQKNGQLDDSLLVPVRGGTLLAPVARQWNAMRKVALADGVILTPTSTGGTYRNLEVQENFFRSRYQPCSAVDKDAILWGGSYWKLKPGVALAAVPGRSNHGWGLSIDVHLTRTGKEKDWLLANALRFGFCWEYVSEPWRLTFFPGDDPVWLWTARSFELATSGMWLRRPDVSMVATGVITRRNQYRPGCAVVLSNSTNNHAISADTFTSLSSVPSVIVTSSKLEELPEDILSSEAAIYQVEDTRAALRDFAFFARSQFQGSVIAITGSAGKTTTARMLASTLRSLKYNVQLREGYGNLSGGIARVLRSVPWDADFYIVETAQGTIDASARLLRPDIAIITNAGPGHLEANGSPLRVARRKARIFRALPDNGVAIVCLDSDHSDVLVQAAQEQRVRLITYGRHPEASIRLSEWDEEKSTATVSTPVGDLSFLISAGGLHMVQNAMASIAAVTALDLDIKSAIGSFATFRPVKGRGTVHQLPCPGGVISLIDESYNANPLSMRAAFDNAHTQFKKGRFRRLVFILGDMLELGSGQDKYHTELADLLIQQPLGTLVLCGPLMAKLAPVLRTMTDLPIETFASADLVTEWALGNLRAGDMVMIKSSHGVGLHQVVEKLLRHFRAESWMLGQ